MRDDPALARDGKLVRIPAVILLMGISVAAGAQEKAHSSAAALMENGVKNAIESGAMTPDLGGHETTGSFARAVIGAMAND